MTPTRAEIPQRSAGAVTETFGGGLEDLANAQVIKLSNPQISCEHSHSNLQCGCCLDGGEYNSAQSHRISNTSKKGKMARSSSRSPSTPLSSSSSSFLAGKNIVIILLLCILFIRDVRETNRTNHSDFDGVLPTMIDSRMGESDERSVSETGSSSSTLLPVEAVAGGGGDTPPPSPQGMATSMPKQLRDHLNRETRHIPLQELVMTSNFKPEMCPNGTTFINSTFIDPTSATDTLNATLPPRKIPRIVHITAKFPCMTPAFERIMQRWHLEGHSFAFHDEAAVDRLLGKLFPEFPNLHFFRECVVSGAGKADLWRYLVLYEYGGIYSDMDTAPGKRFFQDGAIQPEDDAYAVVARDRKLTQYFVAASPKHPIMYYSIHQVLKRLFAVGSVLKQNVPRVTGPYAMRAGVSDFSQGSTPIEPAEGTYVGLDGRTLRVVGSRDTTEAFMNRYALTYNEKTDGYAKLNTTSFKVFARYLQEEERSWLQQPCKNLLFKVADRQRSP